MYLTSATIFPYLVSFSHLLAALSTEEAFSPPLSLSLSFSFSSERYICSVVKLGGTTANRASTEARRFGSAAGAKCSNVSV